jgi:DnaD/phage-associated family protein
MAKKRMFDLDIINQDSFYDLPMEAKALYFLLGMEADDEGFISPKKILRLYGGTEDSVKILVAKGYIIPFKSGVVVITDWKRNNWLDNRRIKSTIYQEEKSQITYDETVEKYVLSNCLADAKQMLRENRIEENRIEENRVVVEESNDDTAATTIFNFLESNFGRTISPIEVEKLNEWLKEFNEDILKYAIELCCNANAKNFNYLNAILKSWKSKGFKKLEECKNENIKRTNKPIREEPIPEWFEKEKETRKATKEELEEMKILLSEYQDP